uniref:GATOR complex protein MIO zinc-ribbon like domain-containing protein n=1 Tax=Panagrolaimus superbus TaxID=310955 RepID=A0A914Y3N0_9BILA
MIPIVSELRWLRYNPRRFFTVDSDAFSLYEVDRGYKFDAVEVYPERVNYNGYDSEKDDDQIKSPPIKKVHQLDFIKNDGPRSVALSYLQDSVVALSFSDRIVFHRANADPTRVPDDEIKLKKAPVCIDWSSVDKHKFLVVGERSPAQNKDNSFTILDLEKASNTGYDNVPRLLHWPVREKLTAGSFFPEERDLVALVSQEYIRIVDIRGRERHAAAVVESTDGRPFIGLQVEPNIGYRFLTYRCDPKDTDNDIHVYDRRYLKQPIYVHKDYTHEKARIRRCIWNPHRRFTINSLTVDANKVHDFSISPSAYDYGSIFSKPHTSVDTVKEAINNSIDWYPYMHNTICFPGIHNVRNFEWHPKYENHLTLIIDRPKQDLRHIHFTTISRDTYATLGSNNECAYSYRQFACVAESIVQQPLRGHRIRFLDVKNKDKGRRHHTPKEEVLPFQFSEGMFYLDQTRRIHNHLTCREENCVDCMRVYLNTKNDESERRRIEDKYFSKYWDSIHDEAQRNMRRSISVLDNLLNGDDISVIMRQRAEHGYGYGQARDPIQSMVLNCQNAIRVDPKLTTSELDFVWNWIEKIGYTSPKYDLKTIYGTTYAGIEFLVNSVASQSSQFEENCDWGCSRVFTNGKRQQMLKMCMWPEFENTIDAYLRVIFISLAACQGQLAKDYLRKTMDKIKHRDPNQRLKFRDENFEMLTKKTLKIIDTFNGANFNTSEYEACRVMLKDEPILLACVTFIARRLNYSKHMRVIELKPEDRIMFALINMDDKLLQETFYNLMEEMYHQEPLKTLMFVGLYDCDKTHKAILRYYENTNDCQTCSILYVIGKCFKDVEKLKDPPNFGLKTDKLADKLKESVKSVNHKRGLNCFFDYLNILGSWNMNIERTFLYNQLYEKNSQNKGRITRAQAVVACSYCNRAAYPCTMDRFRNYKAHRGREMPDNFPNRARISTCGACRKPLPKCVVCRHHYGSLVDSLSLFGESENSLDHSFVFCVSCHHGGHYVHLKDWFKDYDICPATGCECRCSKRDGALLDENVLKQSEEMERKDARIRLAGKKSA